jgi:predicted MFS family arabinose efflux permease
MLLAPLGGAIADRFERRRLLIALDVARALFALLPLVVHDAQTIWLVYVCLLLLQIGTCIYNPAQSAYFPALVSSDLIPAANAAYSTMRDVGIFVGPTLASLVLVSWGTTPAFLVNALSFAVSAAMLMTLPRTAVGTMRELKPGTLFSGYLATIGRYPSVGYLTLCYLASDIPIFYFQGTMIAYMRVLGQPSSFVGVVYAAAGMGGVVAGLIMGQYQQHFSTTLATALFLVGIPALGLLALVHSAPLALLVVATSTLAGTTGHLTFTLYVQRGVASAELGRAFGLLSWGEGIGQFVGAVLGMAVATPLAVSMLPWVSFAALPVALVGATLFLAVRRPVALRGVDTAIEGA